MDIRVGDIIVAPSETTWYQVITSITGDIFTTDDYVNEKLTPPKSFPYSKKSISILTIQLQLGQYYLKRALRKCKELAL